MKHFINAFNQIQFKVHQVAIDKGWWDEPRNWGELIALIHSEASEALEVIRDGTYDSRYMVTHEKGKYLEGISVLEEELADIVIRVMDFAQSHNLDIGTAIIKKNEFNKTRPERHGGKKF